MSTFYDGTKLLSLKDINGNQPEIYICTSNRSAGKTTYFSRLLVNRFLKYGEKFCLIYRYNYELDEVADKFFKDINKLFFKGAEMTAQKRAKGVFYEMFLGGVSCGYAISLNNADQIKKYSHLLSDTANMFFDEFQSETNHYCSDEVKKFISVHTSIARGRGKQVRRVPVYMASNPVTIINPYYVEMGVSSRLRSDTVFLRGDGFVLEQGFVETASNAQKESPFNRAFQGNGYILYSAEAVYLNDNYAFIEKPSGRCMYVCTIKYNGTEFGVREFTEQGFIYCDDRPDTQFPTRITTTTEDHNVNYVMLDRASVFISKMRYLFERGCFRFKDLRCKEAVLSMLKY